MCAYCKADPACASLDGEKLASFELRALSKILLNSDNYSANFLLHFTTPLSAYNKVTPNSYNTCFVGNGTCSVQQSFWLLRLGTGTSLVLSCGWQHDLQVIKSLGRFRTSYSNGFKIFHACQLKQFQCFKTAGEKNYALYIYNTWLLISADIYLYSREETR